jgi:hypothetical protein
MATRISFSVIISDRCFVVVTAAAENPVSQKCVDTKGKESFVSLSDKLKESVLFSGSQK